MCGNFQIAHLSVSFHCHAHLQGGKCYSWLTQVVDAANLLISDDKRVGTVLLIMAKLGLMEWVPAKQNLRPVTAPTGLTLTGLTTYLWQTPCASLLSCSITCRFMLHLPAAMLLASIVDQESDEACLGCWLSPVSPTVLLLDICPRLSPKGSIALGPHIATHSSFATHSTIVTDSS